MASQKKKKSAETSNILPFEKPLEEVRSRLEELEALAGKTSQDLGEELEFYRDRLNRLTKEVYSDITPWNRVQVARHPDRPLVSDFIDHCCENWVELHGDGSFADDRAIVTGLATLGTQRVLLVGHRKGRDTKGRMACNFGSAHPEGYRKALQKMRLAEHMGLPIVCLINTPGAYPGVAAEERGQARAIAENIRDMFALKVPVVAVILGEGGSGGALGIAVADRVGMMENSWYSVISPEGCASILWHSADGREKAAEALQLTSEPLLRLGIVDKAITEPSGGAHRDPEGALEELKEQILFWLDELLALPPEQLLEERHLKFRNMTRSISVLETAMNPAQTGHEEPLPDPFSASERRAASLEPTQEPDSEA
ncbi:MAG: acetyl-CoA carboxylase carboxyltransferase subunit alpha [Planctomycetota bacterium]|jgi:acetyl-CoA carboxylase carboxyl transferase subunit alpha|nr:acetyl-CoA carboxylase carboxyltransferase subunit alpha [Planctomycetota bacterium]MDP6940535.1 acetyl-CoA carboxylase carboxyltransferase subunit alpha [Planctomycetota bacterium]